MLYEFLSRTAILDSSLSVDVDVGVGPSVIVPDGSEVDDAPQGSDDGASVGA